MIANFVVSVRFLVGALVGFFFGYLICALMVMAQEGDKERQLYR